jgi:hypothetical protein
MDRLTKNKDKEKQMVRQIDDHLDRLVKHIWKTETKTSKERQITKTGKKDKYGRQMDNLR